MRKGNKFFLKSPRPSLPLKRAPPLTPTLSPSGKREETAPPRRSEPLRSKVGGPKRSTPYCAGWDRLDTMLFMPLISYESEESKDSLNMLLSSH